MYINRVVSGLTRGELGRTHPLQRCKSLEARHHSQQRRTVTTQKNGFQTRASSHRCTDANFARATQNLPHVISPRTGFSAFESAKVWTRCSSSHRSSQEQKRNPDQYAPLAEHAVTSSTTSTSPKPAPKQPFHAIRTAATHENIYTLPNFLTFTRLLAGPGLAYLIAHDQHLWTLGVFIYAGITDLLDGWIARRWNQQTVVGSVVDPMADKTLMTATTLALAAQARLPWPLAVIVLGRDALLGLAALYYRWISLPPPKTMARYWDFSLPSAEVRPTGISKVNTALQLVLIGATVALPVLPTTLVETWNLGLGLWGFQWLTGFTTVWSGMSYVWSKDAVRIIKQPKSGSLGKE